MLWANRPPHPNKAAQRRMLPMQHLITALHSEIFNVLLNILIVPVDITTWYQVDHARVLHSVPLSLAMSYRQSAC